MADYSETLALALCKMNNFISIKSGMLEAAIASAGLGGRGGDGRDGRRVTTSTAASTISNLSNKNGKLSGDILFDINPFQQKTILEAIALVTC